LEHESTLRDTRAQPPESSVSRISPSCREVARHFCREENTRGWSSSGDDRSSCLLGRPGTEDRRQSRPLDRALFENTGYLESRASLLLSFSSSESISSQHAWRTVLYCHLIHSYGFQRFYGDRHTRWTQSLSQRHAVRCVELCKFGTLD